MGPLYLCVWPNCPGLTGPVGHMSLYEECQMSYKITDACTACGSCLESCPAEAIKEGDEKYTINPDLCIDCGSCVETCPAEAIVED
jgi:ferredoxin